MVHPHAQSIRVLGIPMDLGQQRRGVDMGPSAVRYAGLYDRLTKEGHTVDDLGSMDVVEINPILDEGNRTAELAVELIASALGKKIL